MLRGAGTHLWNRGEADAAFHRLVIWLAAAIVSVGCAAPRDGASPGLSPTRRLTAPSRGGGSTATLGEQVLDATRSRALRFATSRARASAPDPTKSPAVLAIGPAGS